MRKWWTLALLIGAVWAQAGPQGDSLRIAVYLFEMQGRFDQASALLTRISQSSISSPDEKTQALFYLGKIAELSHSDSIAKRHYAKALAGTNKSSVAYWLAERDAALSHSAKQVLLGSQQLPSPPVQTITGRNPGFLLSNQQVWTVQNGKLQANGVQAPKETDVLAIGPMAIWYHDAANPEILRGKPLRESRAGTDLPLDGPIAKVLPVDGQHTVVQTKRSLYWIHGDQILWKVNGRYTGCIPYGIYAPMRQLVIACPDNALHFLSRENGNEKLSIALVDKVDKAILDDEGILLTSSGMLWYFQPHIRPEPIWRFAEAIVQDFVVSEDKVSVLGTDGTMTLLDKSQGSSLSSNRSDGQRLAQLGTGLLGSLSKDGHLTVFDTLLTPVWHYNFASPLQAAPLLADSVLYFPLANGRLVLLDARYYGKGGSPLRNLEKRALLLAESGSWKEVPEYIDSLMRLERGNPAAWYLKARLASLNQPTQAPGLWSQAAGFARRDPEIATQVLKSYAKEIGAQYVQYLDISPQTLYPRLFGDNRNLYIFDPAARRVSNLIPVQGQVRWQANLRRLEQSAILDQDNRTLAIASGFQVEVLDLMQKGRSRTIELPGKPFQMLLDSSALFVTTWNGFLLRYQRNTLALSWSRKLFATPSYIARSGESLHVLSQDGEMLQLEAQSAEPIQEGASHMANAAFFRSDNGLLLLANQDDQVQVLLEIPGYPLVSQFRAGSQILSAEMLRIEGEPHVLLGLANQELALFRLRDGHEAWRYEGSGSIYVQPVIYGGKVWIDQKHAIVGLDLQTGNEWRRFPMPSGSGPVFASGNMVYCATPQRLLYAFPIRP